MASISDISTIQEGPNSFPCEHARLLTTTKSILTKPAPLTVFTEAAIN